MLGRPLGDTKAKEKIGFLPEEAYFQRHLTAVEFLNFCARTLHMDNDLRKRRVEEMLALVSMSDKANTKLMNFSKGMLQRVGVAQALLNDPDLVIFDEPLTGLDPMGRSELKEIMLELKQRGKTVFFSSHILSDVQAISDRVAIMNKGQLIYQGLVSELLDVDTIDVTVDEVPASLLDTLEKMSESLSKHQGSWVFSLSNVEQKKEFEAHLKKEKLKIASTSISYKELEPVFLSKIEENNQQRGL